MCCDVSEKSGELVQLDGVGLGFFFFKQKTAYEMRISDWSSDVCSSDLRWRTTRSAPCLVRVKISARSMFSLATTAWSSACFSFCSTQIGRASCRERVCQYV